MFTDTVPAVLICNVSLSIYLEKADPARLPDEPIVRVSYDYKTIAQKPITIVDINELRRLIQQGETLQSKSTTYTAGPLSIEIKTGDFVKTQSTDPTLPVYIAVTNDLWESGG